MRRLTLVAMGVCLAGSTGLAQDPLKVNPKVYHVVVDNPQVRVLHVMAAAGAKTVMHEHPDNITVLLTDGKMTFTDAAGKTETVDMKAGQALFGPQKHMGVNTGTSDARSHCRRAERLGGSESDAPCIASEHDHDAARAERPRRRLPHHGRRRVQGGAEARSTTTIRWSSHWRHPRSRSRSAARPRRRGSVATRCSSAAVSRTRRRARAARLRTSSSSRSSSAGGYHCFSRMFRYSTFIGGPTCTCTPSRPSVGRFAVSSSTVTLITRPLSM